MMRYWGIFLMALLLSACGRKGPLVRPEALVPDRITDFSVVQKGENLHLSWSLPKRLVSGGKLTDLAGFRLLAREIPADGGCPDCPDSWQQLGRFDLEFLKGAQRVGDRLYYTDTDAKTGRTYGYRLISYTDSATESAPAEARSTRRPPLPPPVLTATSTYLSVTLGCTPPPLPAGYVSGGCAVYRTKGGEPFPLTPYAVVPTDGRYEDTLLEPGIIYTYSISTVATIDGQRVESYPALHSAGLKEPD